MNKLILDEIYMKYYPELLLVIYVLLFISYLLTQNDHLGVAFVGTIGMGIIGFILCI